VVPEEYHFLLKKIKYHQRIPTFTRKKRDAPLIGPVIAKIADKIDRRITFAGVFSLVLSAGTSAAT